MKDQFIPYEQAKMMKQLGFNNTNCFGFYWERFKGEIILDFGKTNIQLEGEYALAPLYHQAEEWLWGQHAIYLDIIQIPQEEAEWIFQASICNSENCYDSYQATSPIIAHREGILAAINYIHQNKK